jgi:N-acetylmuramoyl-L-alanine amidase
MSDQFKVGDRSDAIGIIANTLNRLGFLDKTSDLFDQSLEEAIKAFQQERGFDCNWVSK